MTAVLADTHLMRFAFGGCGLATYPPGATFGPRTLRDHEFVWIVDGEVEWEVEGRRIAAPAGSVLLGRPGMRDRFAWDPRRRTVHGFVHFQLATGSARLPPPSSWPLARHPGSDEVLRPLLRHLLRLLSEREGPWEELAQGAARQALLAFITGTGGTAGETAAPATAPVERAFELVARRWTAGRMQPIPLGELARAAGVTPGHLVRLFRQEVGAPPLEALRLIRLERAANLLARTNLAVQAVAREVGFADAFLFSRRFRSRYGSGPREFRRRVAEGMNIPLTPLVRTRSLAARLSGGA